MRILTKTLARKAQDEPHGRGKRKQSRTDMEMACWLILGKGKMPRVAPTAFASVLDDTLHFLAYLPTDTAAAIAEIEKLRLLEPDDFCAPSTVTQRPTIDCAHKALDHAITWISALPVETLDARLVLQALRYKIPEHARVLCLV
ncbi:hypothetical protein SPRG_11718 [Saprolegnia parasitica CBS 223.65]|uniref:Uncharacterized protein n=1 Tax=Saprolegnia parasitica (strain CBS 223.65) TaxID=695850 RepID=A0A067C7K4_SAPPC|nr:hypothetical protein SPRG_11718 [Saprolegnia parasitica CBS 223.65]KDO22536.1 hypothetical protein SPRG_11718 [Saprolegnia parasitica CBS 223.65]|eukprot:XP_012206782.1 hypothetical protein SPRG_11718 [Saprolegnia parasitica CBS 223.65]